MKDLLQAGAKDWTMVEKMVVSSVYLKAEWMVDALEIMTVVEKALPLAVRQVEKLALWQVAVMVELWAESTAVSMVDLWDYLLADIKVAEKDKCQAEEMGNQQVGQQVDKMAAQMVDMMVVLMVSMKADKSAVCWE